MDMELWGNDGQRSFKICEVGNRQYGAIVGDALWHMQSEHEGLASSFVSQLWLRDMSDPRNPLILDNWPVLNKSLPSQVIVRPKFSKLNPHDESDDRDQVIGHVISAGSYIFPQSGAQGIFKEYSEGVKTWMDENNYTHTSDLTNSFMATPGLHGIWTKESKQ